MFLLQHLFFLSPHSTPPHFSIDLAFYSDPMSSSSVGRFKKKCHFKQLLKYLRFSFLQRTHHRHYSALSTSLENEFLLYYFEERKHFTPSSTWVHSRWLFKAPTETSCWNVSSRFPIWNVFLIICLFSVKWFVIIHNAFCCSSKIFDFIQWSYLCSFQKLFKRNVHLFSKSETTQCFFSRTRIIHIFLCYS